MCQTTPFLCTWLMDFAMNIYASITDTWDESTVTLDKAKTDLKVKAVRVEQRIGKAAGF